MHRRLIALVAPVVTALVVTATLSACSSSGGDHPSTSDPSAKVRSGGLLDGHGRVVVAKLPKASAAARSAACAYVYGDAAEVSRRAKTGSLHLYQPAAASDRGLLCAYSTTAVEQAFVIAIGDDSAVSSALTTGHGAVIIVNSDVTLALGYRSEYTGKTIAKQDAKDWLVAARKRVVPAG